MKEPVRERYLFRHVAALYELTPDGFAELISMWRSAGYSYDRIVQKIAGQGASVTKQGVANWCRELESVPSTFGVRADLDGDL